MFEYHKSLICELLHRVEKRKVLHIIYILIPMYLDQYVALWHFYPLQRFYKTLQMLQAEAVCSMSGPESLMYASLVPRLLILVRHV